MSIKRIWHKIKAIPFIGVPYEKLIGNKKVKRIEQRNKAELQEKGMSYLKTVEDTLAPSGAVYFAYAGTLLGIARERKLISWDMDIDYAVVISPEFTWEDLEKSMRAAGFHKSREFRYNGMVTEQSYSIRSMNIDFFGIFPQGDHMVQYTAAFLPNETYQNENEQSVYIAALPNIPTTIQLIAGDVAVTVPENYETVLASIYDENWRIPNPHWVANTGTCVRLLVGEKTERYLF